MRPRSSSPTSLRAVHALIAVYLGTAVLQAQAADVVAFTDAQHPLSNTNGARVVLLDAPTHVEATLSAQLPRDPTQAEAVVRARLSQSEPELRERLTSAYQNVVEAWALKVAKVPAIVVDRRYVVYGEIDVAAAVQRIAAYRDARP